MSYKGYKDISSGNEYALADATASIGPIRYGDIVNLQQQCGTWPIICRTFFILIMIVHIISIKLSYCFLVLPLMLQHTSSSFTTRESYMTVSVAVVA